MIFNVGVFLRYVWPPSALQDPLIREGLVTTVVVAVVAMVLASGLGLIGALCRLSRNRVMRGIALAYVTYFRGTPVVVQLFIVYFGASSLGWFHFDDATVGSIVIAGAMQAGIVALAINEGAYLTEIFRSGIMSVERGQLEAARAIGMTYRGAMRWVILPQAIRIILPSFGNRFNGMILITPILITIGGRDLFGVFEAINGTNYHPIELFLACSGYILVLSLTWSAIQRRLERRFGRSLADIRVSPDRALSVEAMR